MNALSPTPEPTRTATPARVRVEGKFLFAGSEKFYIRGVTYGTFRPRADGTQYGAPDVVERDLVQMRDAGINAVRTYTVPPRWLLDLAARYGLYVMLGLPWEQHIAFLDERGLARDITSRVRAMVREVAGHPAILCYTIGNEIPAPIVRWHGRERTERFLKQLYTAVKEEDPQALVTYVNYPSTEYLQLPFVDFFCFNVYLETEERLEAYLARLQNIAGERPLVMAEIGLDSRRNGTDAQARTLEWQVRTVFAAGCAGTFIYAWTDEWWRGGYDIEDWDFGLTTRERQSKPALASVTKAFAEVPFPKSTKWPRISVVVCTYNGARFIRNCMEGLSRVDYPNFEVIVVNDGSTDETASIVSEYPFRIISTENRGLSAARNTGMEAATGEIVAYTDDDARPDPHWLQYLAHSYMTTTHAGIGGPNIAPAGDGLIADCVANAPGGPVHVLTSDSEAEHVPGCNMSFRKEMLLRVGGCDPIYRTAGDDVDLCWRVQDAGGTIGFSPAAMVWHHRRNSVKAYWKQQLGYGKAEALLEAKWPEKYNVAGHLTWTGRLYGKGLTQALMLSRGRIYQGTWGSGLFQSIYQPAPGLVSSLPLMPEWYLIIISLIILSALGLAWTPLLWAAPLLIISIVALLAQAALSASRANFTSAHATRLARFKFWGMTALLHVLQPLARLKGRLRWGLTPWRKRGVSGFALPRSRTAIIWSERWQAAEDKLRTIEKALREEGACVFRGGDFDRWDLTVRGGMLGAARLHMTVEEHGGGCQLARFRTWPRFSFLGLSLFSPFIVLSVLAAFDGASIVAALLGLSVSLFAMRSLYEAAASASTVMRTLGGLAEIEMQGAQEAEAHMPAIAQPTVPEATLAPTKALEPALTKVRVASAGGAPREAIVPPSAVSSVGSSLFLNHLPVENSSRVTE